MQDAAGPAPAPSPPAATRHGRAGAGHDRRRRAGNGSCALHGMRLCRPLPRALRLSAGAAGVAGRPPTPTGSPPLRLSLAQALPPLPRWDALPLAPSCYHCPLASRPPHTATPPLTPMCRGHRALAARAAQAPAVADGDGGCCGCCGCCGLLRPPRPRGVCASWWVRVQQGGTGMSRPVRP